MRSILGMCSYPMANEGAGTNECLVTNSYATLDPSLSEAQARKISRAAWLRTVSGLLRAGPLGGKIAKADRVEWVTMPDAQTAMNALQSGDIDFMENTSEYRQVGVRTGGLGCAGLFHAARTVARNSSTAFLRWSLSVRSARAELWTCPAAEPVSVAPRLTSAMLLSMWLAPCAAC